MYYNVLALENMKEQNDKKEVGKGIYKYGGEIESWKLLKILKHQVKDKEIDLREEVRKFTEYNSE